MRNESREDYLPGCLILLQRFAHLRLEIALAHQEEAKWRQFGLEDRFDGIAQHLYTMPVTESPDKAHHDFAWLNSEPCPDSCSAAIRVELIGIHSVRVQQNSVVRNSTVP